MRSRITFLIIFLIFNTIVFSQELGELKFQRAAIDLVGEASLAFIEDSDGFFWIGSTSGLYKYNGYEFQVYKAGEDSLSASYVNALYQDSDGQYGLVPRVVD